jgi:hypothetical protein
MRNIFDQYSQPENRLTHALVSCLCSDPRLLRQFVKWTTGQNGPATQGLKIDEQCLPGEDSGGDEMEAERRGLPDAWIHDGQSWALIVESKIQAPLTNSQLERHRRTAERREFSEISLVALVVQRPRIRPKEKVIILEWTQVYRWFCKQARSSWARFFTEYMEVLERKLVADEYLRKGKLTVFSGIHFGNERPYNYGEAKRLIQLMTDELRGRSDLKRQLKIDPRGEGRPAITGRETSSLWDILSLAQARGSRAFT